jgi:hypothetical protein
MPMTPFEIAKACEDLKGRANICEINRLFRKQDESHLWPIRGRFNVTNRAIKKAQKFCNEINEDLHGFEYADLLDSIMSEIVNNPKNW